MNIYFDKCSDALSFATNTKTLGVFYSKENTSSLNVHTHECCEILFCIKGGRNFLIDDKIYKINDGDIFIINQFEAHKITFEVDCPIERFTLQIHPEFIFSTSTDLTDLSKCFYIRNKNTSNCLSLSSPDKEYLLGLFLSLKNDYDYGDDVMKKSIIMQLLTFVNQKFITDHSADECVEDKRLKNAILYINNNFSEELSLEILAKNSYTSVNQLCKLFKTSLGTTVMKYVTGKRISQAKKYLQNGMSVSETAEKCGFNDYSNFIRVFTKSVGVSPGKYASKN